MSTTATAPQLELTRGNVVQVLNLFALILLATASHMVGEFFREGAVLMMVFVPLELWKSQGGTINFPLILHVAEVSLFTLAVGMFLEWTSLLAARIKRNLEAAYAGK